MNIAEQLAQISLFQNLSPEYYEKLASIILVKDFDRNSFIFADGDDGVGFYVIVSGRVKIYKMSPEGKEQILHILGPGEEFAEVAVFSGSQYPANAETLAPSKLFFFPKDSFIRLISSNPSLAMNMLASLSLRLKRFSHMIEALSLKEVPGRLAAHLLYLSEQNAAGGMDHLKLDVAKVQLAGLLGTIPETLSRILTKMNKQGLIESSGPDIRIINRPGLEDLAAGETRLS
jgi:CRP/FNR family transcriptional regulator